MTPDPSKFKPPHTWATYIPSRADVFKTHSSFHVAKSAVRSSLGYNRGSWLGAWVYRWDQDEDEWILEHHIEHMDPDHPDTEAFFLIRMASKRAAKAPTKAQMDAALASIASVGT